MSRRTAACTILLLSLSACSPGPGGGADYTWGSVDAAEDTVPGTPDVRPEDSAPPAELVPGELAPGPDLCTPSCADRECGDDGCGGSCGNCPGAAPLCEEGLCVPETCVPDCAGKTCGPDGCGGSCGTCPAGQGCGPAFTCVCAPDCTGKVCGPDGCGGSCGACGGGTSCQGGACVPDACTVCAPWQTCAGGPCQDPPSQGTCPFGGIALGSDCFGTAWEGCCDGDHLYYCENSGNEGCPAGMTSCLCALDCATESATCSWGTQFFLCNTPPAVAAPDGSLACAWAGTCTPSCVGKVCGPDGCGGSCGTCPAGKTCQGGACVTASSACAGFCGGQANENCYCDESCEQYGDCCPEVCAACPALTFCACTPSCGGKECGPDGCGGTCGTCPQVAPDCVNGLCQLPCEPQCEGKECGDDGCGGACGPCPVGFTCQDTTCVPCTPQCAGKQCGPDGCGAMCGTCAQGTHCTAGICMPDCTPDCQLKECGEDGCGGICGLCPCEGCNAKEFECSTWGSCTQPFTYTCKQIDQCTGTCAEGDSWCAQSCKISGSTEAKADLDALLECLELNGYFACAAGDAACQEAVVQGPCWTPWQTCFHGTLTCSQLHDCVFDLCAADPDCGGLCFQDAAVAAQDLFLAFDGCVTGQCGEEPAPSCRELAENGVCAALLVACLSDD